MKTIKNKIEEKRIPLDAVSKQCSNDVIEIDEVYKILEQDTLRDVLEDVFGNKNDTNSLVGEIKKLNDNMQEIKDEINKLKSSLDDLRRTL